MDNKLSIVLSVSIYFSIFSYSTYYTKVEDGNGMVDWSVFEAAINSDVNKQNLDFIIESKEKIEEQSALKEQLQSTKVKAGEVRDKHVKNIKPGDIKRDKITGDISERKGFVDSALSSKSSETSTVYLHEMSKMKLE